ncbi:TonB-dependent receptor [Pelagicoccus sp. SDUM812005]|uniref:TonB-dependent receptor domain-containing protein n=1 Tax=Pelagicoccus sp. SDUM812005 TaxID=3041257 RepID=UPI00280F7AD8|nr:TonB-dependent receptor [Pelagicoccus sp. SDUM812005]MDQ8181207.1 TonB-dependent receptor [Pelagicoccus sp. SDUM812005]
MTTQQTFNSLATALGFLGATTLSFAQSEVSASEDVIDLAPFVVSGETYAFGAQKIVHVTDKDLERLQAVDLADIFSQDPSIMVGGGISAAEKIYVRGIEDKMLNVSVDGATQAGYLSHHQAQYSIEPELLKFAEAEPGAGAASAGPGALAGVIRFENKGAADFLEGDDTFGSFAKVSYGSNGDQLKLTGALYGNVNSTLSALFAYTYSESNDYKDGNGDTVELTSSDTDRAFLKLDAQIDANQTLDFSFEDRSNEGTFRHRPNFYGDFNHPRAPNDPVFMTFDRQTATLGYGYVASDRNLDLQAKLYHTDNSVDRADQYEMGYESLGFDLSNTAAYSDHTVNYGLNYRDDTAYFTGKGQTTLRPPFSSFLPPLVYTTIPDETIEILGFFAQDEWQVTDRLQASFGIRWDEYEYSDKDGQTFKDSGFSPNLGISFAATDELDLNVSYGTAFRGVTPIDLITANEGGVTNHDSIDPEWAKNLEIGFQYDNGTYFANGTLYQQRIDDVILSSGIRDNGGDLEVDGYDFTFGLRHGEFTSSLGVSHSKPELNGAPLVDTDFGLGSSYGRTWNANTAYAFPDLKLNVGWSLNFVEKYDESTEPLAHKPSYAVHDFYAQWTTGEEENITLTLTLDNAFDKFYVDQATAGYNGQLARVAGLAAPGRDIRLSTSIKF